MKRLTKWLSTACMVTLAIGWSACRKRVDPGAAETRELPEGRPCPPTAMIGDGESANKTSFQEGRGGWWYTYVDVEKQGGSNVWPTAGILGGTFEPSEGGAAGTKYAARMKGTIGDGEIVFAGMGTGFVDPQVPTTRRSTVASRFGRKKARARPPRCGSRCPTSRPSPKAACARARAATTTSASTSCSPTTGCSTPSRSGS